MIESYLQYVGNCSSRLACIRCFIASVVVDQPNDVAKFDAAVHIICSDGDWTGIKQDDGRVWLSIIECVHRRPAEFTMRLFIFSFPLPFLLWHAQIITILDCLLCATSPQSGITSLLS